MDAVAILFTLLAYALAGYLGWQQRTPIFLLALVSGHLSAVVVPLWSLLYGANQLPSLASIQAILSQPVPLSVTLVAGWHYALPAIVVLYLYITRWWFPGYVSGLLTFCIFLLYHLLIEALSLRASPSSYSGISLPFSLPGPVFTALMNGLISYGLLYMLLAVYRYAWSSMALAVLPATLILSLLVQGLFGAPLWITLLLRGQGWVISIGLLSALAILLWAVHIVTSGLRRIEN